MTIRIGQIPYLNSEVFYRGMDPSVVELAPLVPRALSGAAEDGWVDAGPVPLVTCFELEDRFEPLGSFCIATVERARSILFYSRTPIEQLDGAAVGVTGETSTSVRLLKALLNHRFAVMPRSFDAVSDSNDAFLLIGDEALRNRQGVAGHPYQYDLGEVWHQWTGLPFVFARWVARRDLDRKLAAWIEAALDQNIDRNLAQVEQIAVERRDLGMSPDEVMEYVRSFHYRLGAPELESIEKFRGLLKEEEAVSPSTSPGKRG